MKKAFLFTVLAAATLFQSVAAANYTIDDKQIDNLITVSAMANENSFSLGKADTDAASPASGYSNYKDGTTAVVLGLLLGHLGIHRLYLGTSVGTFLAYALTAGGCGVLYVVDNVLLIIALIEDEPIEMYMDKPGLFMWED